MPRYLKGHYRKGMPLHAISASDATWLSNFFNTSSWIGFVVKFTANGRGCSIRTEGETETVELAEDLFGTDIKSLAFEDGRLISVGDA